jgi:ankyrin repeat protein
MVLLLSLLLLANSHELADAVKRGNGDAIRGLLAVGADPDAPDETGIAPLAYAAFDNKTDAVRVLLDYHARVNLEFRGSTPLDLAVASGAVETAQLLIDNGADVRRVYPSGRTPLHIAAAGGVPAMVALLIDRGADVEAQDKLRMSPLDLAITKNQAASVNLLLEAGAKLGPYSLESALRGNNRPEVLKVLLAHSTRPLAPLLKTAIAQNRSSVVEVLIQAGADVNARDDAGFTALHDAALAGNLKAARLLVEHGADVNIGDKDSGATALYMAATMGREDVVSFLLEKGADTNKGPNAAKAATSGGFTKIAEMIRAQASTK